MVALILAQSVRTAQAWVKCRTMRSGRVRTGYHGFHQLQCQPKSTWTTFWNRTGTWDLEKVARCEDTYNSSGHVTHVEAHTGIWAIIFHFWSRGIWLSIRASIGRIELEIWCIHRCLHSEHLPSWVQLKTNLGWGICWVFFFFLVLLRRWMYYILGIEEIWYTVLISWQHRCCDGLWSVCVQRLVACVWHGEDSIIAV